MMFLAAIVEVAYRAACHWTTYMPSAIGSAWFTSTWVEDGFLFVGGDRWAPLDDLDFVFAATCSRHFFPLAPSKENL